MDAKHTPGPWGTVCQYSPEHKREMPTPYIRSVDGRHVAIANYVPSDDEHTANANLIAAAPDLLAALHDAVFVMEDVAQNDYMIDGHYLPNGKELMRIADNCRAAIAKAEGRS